MHDVDAVEIGNTHRQNEFGIALESGGSIRAVARINVVAFCRYCTLIVLGIQRWLVGTVASINMPIAISAALHDAIAWTVER